jgi:hypothetical protein
MQLEAQPVKEKILKAMSELPPNATFEDAIEQILLLRRVYSRLDEAQLGDAVPHDEAQAAFKKWRK